MIKFRREQLITLRRVLKYTSSSSVYIVLSLLSALFTVALTLYLPILTGRAIDLLVGAGQVDFRSLGSILLQMGIDILLTSVLTWCTSACNNRIAYTTVRRIRQDAFRHIQNLPLKYLDRHPIGELVSRVITDVDIFSDGLLMGFTQLFTGILTILTTLFFMFRINVTTAIIVVLVTPLSLFVASFIARKTFSLFKEQSRIRGEQTALVNEIISGEKVVKAFGREKAVVREFDKINSSLEKTALHATFFSSLTNPCTRFVNSMVYALVAIFGAFNAIVGSMTIGQLTCFLSYANQYTKPFNEISSVIAELQNALACASRIFALIDEPVEENDSSYILRKADGKVTLDHVSFRYSEDHPLIEDLNLQVEPGSQIAIVGPTGCGKTTLINLLMRFYDPNSGSISVNSHDIREITRKSLRSNYAMVLQDTFLKTGTIAENIALSKPDASRAEIELAARTAHAHSFIRRMPQGYDTVITENGSGLSEGQKQLLCIARAMLNLPPMLILDEATSSIDTRTEMKIQNVFSAMTQGRTSFIVAHRLSTIRNADMILVMKDGSIVEHGTHKELLSKNGFYARLYNAQFVQ